MTLEHFGNPLLEQRKLQEGKAYVERSDQVVISIAGEDRASWLHALVSQDILNLGPGESTEALLLTPQGRIEHQLNVISHEGELLVITDSTRSEALIDWLTKMRFRAKVSITKTELRVFGVFAETAGASWVDGFSLVPKSSVSYATERAQFSYRELVADAPPELERAGLMAYQALRIAAGRPEISDIDERSLPHEFDWLSSAVHLTKGCYRGQESVAKVHNLGHPPRRLAILHLEQGDALCAKGYRVAMVGDGLNDAAAMTRAHLAVAVHSGQGLAKEAAHITLMRGDPAQLLDFFPLAQRVNRKVMQNLWCAWSYNLVSIPIAMSGLLTPLVAATAMLLSSLTVIGNTLLLIRRK